MKFEYRMLAGMLLVTAGLLAGSDSPQVAAGPAAAAALLPPARAVYRLSPGDVIDIRLFFNPELNEQVQIRPDGRISLNLLGEVTLAGQTIPEAAALLEQRLAKELRTPRVTIQVRSFAAQKVFVTGEVVRPGLLSLPGSMTLFEAVSEAGGLKNTANRKYVVLIRKGADEKPLARRIALFDGIGPSAAAGVPLQAFDVIMVPESRVAHVDRWIDQHIRQMIPINVAAGFTYLTASQGGIPVF